MPDNARQGPGEGRPILLMTRPLAQGRRFAAEVRAAAGPIFRTVIAPALEIVPRPLPPAARQALVQGAVPVFTSANGVACAGPAPVPGQPCWAVGSATARAARRAGYAPRIAGPDAQGLASAILASGDPGPFLHLRGAHAAADLGALLRGGGREAMAAVIYDQHPCPAPPAALAALGGAVPVLLPLFSRRSAQAVAAWLGALPAGPAPLTVVTMGQSVAEAWTGPGGIRVADPPGRDAILARVIAELRAM